MGNQTLSLTTTSNNQQPNHQTKKMMIFKFVTVSIVAMTAEARRPHHARLDFFNQFDLTSDCKAFVIDNIHSLTVRDGEISKPRCDTYTYDRNFCIKVCELQENDQCIPIDSSISFGNTCQYPAAYMPYDDSSSSSSS